MSSTTDCLPYKLKNNYHRVIVSKNQPLLLGRKNDFPSYFHHELHSFTLTINKFKEFLSLEF